jgi:hypothetical protein
MSAPANTWLWGTANMFFGDAVAVRDAGFAWPQPAVHPINNRVFINLLYEYDDLLI